MNASEEGEPRMKWKRDRDGSGANLHRSETRDPPQSSLLIKLYNHVLLKLHNNHALLKKLSHQSCHQRSFKTFRHKKGRFACIRIQIKESFSSKSLHQSWCRFNSGWSGSHEYDFCDRCRNQFVFYNQCRSNRFKPWHERYYLTYGWGWLKIDWRFVVDSLMNVFGSLIWYS